MRYIFPLSQESGAGITATPTTPRAVDGVEELGDPSAVDATADAYAEVDAESSGRRRRRRRADGRLKRRYRRRSGARGGVRRQREDSADVAAGEADPDAAEAADGDAELSERLAARYEAGEEEEEATGSEAAPAVHASALALRSSLPPSLDVCDHAACTGRLKVISISLYGGNPRYTAGAVRNSEIVRDAFPDWQLWVYIPDPAVNAEYAVPADIKATLEANGARLINVDKATIDAVGFGMNQRFLPAEDATVERFASRDGDSRLLLRERWAMDEWEASGLPFHVLRDHPSHSNFYVSGGLWGGVKGSLPNVRELLSRTAAGKSGYMHDMDFLNADVWPLMEKQGVLQHDAFSCFRVGANAGAWPRPRAGAEHVGGVYDASDTIRRGDVDLLPGNDDSRCLSVDAPAAARTGISPAEVLACGRLLGDAEPAPAKTVDFAAAASGAEEGGEVSIAWFSHGSAAAAQCPGRDTRNKDGSERRLARIALLGAVSAAAPASAAAAKGGAAAAAATPSGVSVLIAWKQAFIDHMYAEVSPSGCAGNYANEGKGAAAAAAAFKGASAGAADQEAHAKALVPPSVFDYDRALLYDSYPHRCLPDAWQPGGAATLQALVMTPGAGEGARAASNGLAASKDAPELPSYARVPQYHERVQRPHTHYGSLGKGGLRQHAHLLVLQAAYTADPHFLVAHGLPYLWYFLRSGPTPYAKVLLPGIPVVEEVITAFVRAGPLAHPIPNANVPAARQRKSLPSAAIPPADAVSATAPWHAQPWVSVHGGPPHLYYAHRAYIAALSGQLPVPQASRQCSSVTGLGVQTDEQAGYVTAVAAAVAAHAQLLFHDPAVSLRDRITTPAAASAPACKAAVLRPAEHGQAAGASAGVAPAEADVLAALKAGGYAVPAAGVLDPCSGSVADHIAALAHAQVAVLPAATLSVYLPYLPAGARVLILEGFLRPGAAAGAAAAGAGARASVDAAVDAVCAAAGLACERVAAVADLAGALGTCSS